MKREAVVDIFAEESNFGVVRMPGRKYPGVVIQGDSLLSILGNIEEVMELFEQDKEEALEALGYVYDELNWRFESYRKALDGEDLPF